MPRMLDLVRSCALPSHQMMSAARGALRVSAEEMVEILVHLAEHNKIFSEQARMTLASWDESSAKAIASNPATSAEVLEYWLTPRNLRPALFPLLLENKSVAASKLAELAGVLKGEWIDVMLATPRIRESRQILNEMSANKEITAPQNALRQSLLQGEPQTATVEQLPDTTTADVVVPEPTGEPTTEPADRLPESEAATNDPEIESALTAFFLEHEKEIAAEKGKPFQAIGGIYEEPVMEQPAKAVAAAVSTNQTSYAGMPTPLHRKMVNPEDEKRGSVLQKISKLDVKGRIQLAMKGNKEERSILVRDGTKIVALAVLDSPKITDGEVEKFASQKNVLEAVLRAIPMKRRFAKNYAVVRNLTFNPRTPLDVSLGLMKNLLVQDLRNLSGNKEVAETIRKLALRQFKQKSEAANKRN